MLISTLGQTDQSQLNKAFLNALCQCIAAIGVVEIPTGNWSDYVSVMTG